MDRRTLAALEHVVGIALIVGGIGAAALVGLLLLVLVVAIALR